MRIEIIVKQIKNDINGNRKQNVKVFLINTEFKANITLFVTKEFFKKKLLKDQSINIVESLDQLTKRMIKVLRERYKNDIEIKIIEI